MKLEEAYTSYLLYAKTERGYAPETLINIQDAFRSRLQPAFLGRDVESITRFDVLQFRNQLIEEKLSVARQYNLLRQSSRLVPGPSRSGWIACAKSFASSVRSR